jgi:hypothetical protein
MNQDWLLVGSEKNWNVSFENNNIWGLKDFRETRALWHMLRIGDGLLFYVSKPVHGIVGFGKVTSKFTQTKPLWPDEISRNEIIWPLCFEFDVEYCLPPNLWKTNRYSTKDIQLITRMVIQCLPLEEVNSARLNFSLRPRIDQHVPMADDSISSPIENPLNHDQLKSCLAEIGRIQGYIGENEYPLENTRLDAVWRRVERSVPTFVFEVQVGGDIYHALAKLKHAFDLWNSHIFLVASLTEKGKCQELLSGTFHEIKDQVKFIDSGEIGKLLEKKKAYKEMERALGILR